MKFGWSLSTTCSMSKAMRFVLLRLWLRRLLTPKGRKRSFLMRRSLTRGPGQIEKKHMIVLWPSALQIKFLKGRPFYSGEGKMWGHAPPYPKVTAYVITDGA